MPRLMLRAPTGQVAPNSHEATPPVTSPPRVCLPPFLLWLYSRIRPLFPQKKAAIYPIRENRIATIATFPFFFFNDTATTEIYTLSLHDALPISPLSVFSTM